MKYERLTKRNEHGEARHATPLKAQFIRELDEETAKRDGKVLRRLCELEDKIEQGTLKEMNYPCNVGDKVFVIRSLTSNNKNFYISEDIVSALGVDIDKTVNTVWLYIAFYQSMSIFEWNFDKVSLTREEAEAKLKELQNG